ncbi:TrkA C-terminal domain-containing protein [soil metagenome]
MIAILTLIVIVTFSFLITRVATIALMHTGLSKEVSRFQARSALTGAGFTTTESERLVNHPVRRRILMLLMLIGNAGIITAVSTLILAFVNQDETESLWLKIVLLVAGLVILWTVAGSQWVDRRLSRLIDKALKQYTSLEVRDFASLLGLSGEYRIVEILVTASSWLANKSVQSSRLREEGVLVLAIQRANGTFLGSPRGHTEINPEDTLILYGHVDALKAVDERPPDTQGRREHRQAVGEQLRREQEERQRDIGEQNENKADPA